MSGRTNASGVADAGAKADSIRQRTLHESSDQGCLPVHNGVLPSEEKVPQKQSGSQCSLHVWSRKTLLNRKDIPKHLQFNPYIETGYRPLLSAWGCIMSLFYFHNETINIITHGVPMLYILLRWRTLLPWSEITVPLLPWTHLVSTVSPWVGSTIYHLFMNHRAGESCYKSLLHLDMFGIWITQSFGALTTVYASVFCLSETLIWKVLVVYCFVSLWCLYKASHARNPWERRFCFTLPFLMRAASATLRGTVWGGGHPDAFRHIILQDLLAVLGGFVGALRVPEKWIPGRLDLLANSHHIMHVVVVYAVYHLHQGAVLDMVWLSKNSTCSLVQSEAML
ncbi:progestin and adipoQ receptor family member 4-like isoform X1 [Penaeus chinensis]|uniref:progestin and adipoQ receptor family member 4-like isoform X1 n=1 Tax=Penaeus chinensis TaxID=139456 RepID=UPI001FB7BDF1|nr:progestin and adipoQ receptor family member 4-like isoform X1 [Penaeus chinensis]